MVNILKLPYLYDNFDHNGIKEYLDLLVPDNMWAFYHSKLLEEEFKESPSSF